MEQKQLQIYYGINVLNKNEDNNSWSRFCTKETLSEATEVYNILTDPSNEQLLCNGAEIEKIEEQENGDWKYTTINSTQSLKVNPLLDRLWWIQTITSNKDQIADITINEECLDPDSDEIMNICWLKVGWVSPSSGCGYFHYSSLEEFGKEMREIVSLHDASKELSCMYLQWLNENRHLIEEASDPNEFILALLRYPNTLTIKKRHGVTK